MGVGGMRYDVCTLKSGPPSQEKMAQDIVSGVCRDIPKSPIPKPDVPPEPQGFLSTEPPTSLSDWLQLALIILAVFSAVLALACLIIGCCFSEPSSQRSEAYASPRKGRLRSYNHLRELNLLYDDEAQSGWGH